MKKFLIVVLLLLALLSACRSDPAGFAGIFRDPAQTIDVRINQEFAVAITSNPASAYMWREDFDGKFLEMVDSTFEINEEKRGTDAMLEQQFRFRALKKGQTTLRLNLKGPDLRTVNIVEFKVNIK